MTYSEAETRQLLKFSGTGTSPIDPVRLDELIVQQAKRTPHAIAMADRDTEITYEELVSNSRLVADRLQRAGIGSDDIVAVCAERSTRMVVAMVGIMIAGAAYLPLDMDYPKKRLSYMVEESHAKAILTDKHFMPHIADIHDVIAGMDADGLPERERKPRSVTADHLAYVIYTSGSTGRPKGVAISHRAISVRLFWMQQQYLLKRTDIVMQKTPYTFDVSVVEFFWPLTTGAKLFMAPPGAHLDPRGLVELVATQRITTIQFVPSMLDLILYEPGLANCSSLRQVFCAGEALPPTTANRFRSTHSAMLYNLYGPTEAAVYATHWTCRNSELGESVPIGTPIGDTTAFVMDDSGALTPLGTPGELYLGGPGLARGYLGNQALTDDRFVHRRIGEISYRLYRTGDLVKWRDDGVLLFLGRLDDQVKLRGLRIELGEIEAIIADHPAVQSCHVTIREDLGSTAKLVAYFVADDHADLRSHTATYVPSYMVPHYFVKLPRLPVTAHGKLDRKALPRPGDLE